MPIKQRVDIWSEALQKFSTLHPAGKLFDLLETGDIVPWEIHEYGP